MVWSPLSKSKRNKPKPEPVQLQENATKVVESHKKATPIKTKQVLASPIADKAITSTTRDIQDPLNAKPTDSVRNPHMQSSTQQASSVDVDTANQSERLISLKPGKNSSSARLETSERKSQQVNTETSERNSQQVNTETSERKSQQVNTETSERKSQQVNTETSERKSQQFITEASEGNIPSTETKSTQQTKQSPSDLKDRVETIQQQPQLKHISESSSFVDISQTDVVAGNMEIENQPVKVERESLSIESDRLNDHVQQTNPGTTEPTPPLTTPTTKANKLNERDESPPTSSIMPQPSSPEDNLATRTQRDSTMHHHNDVSKHSITASDYTLGKPDFAANQKAEYKIHLQKIREHCHDTVVQLNEEITYLSDELERTREQVQIAKADKAQLREQLDIQQGRTASLIQSFREHQRELTEEVQRSGANKELTLEVLRALRLHSLAQVVPEYRNLESQSHQLHAENQRLSTALRFQLAECDGLRQTNREFANQMNTIREQKANSDKQCANLQAQLDEMVTRFQTKAVEAGGHRRRIDYLSDVLFLNAPTNPQSYSTSTSCSTRPQCFQNQNSNTLVASAGYVSPTFTARSGSDSMKYSPTIPRGANGIGSWVKEVAVGQEDLEELVNMKSPMCSTKSPVYERVSQNAVNGKKQVQKTQHMSRTNAEGGKVVRSSQLAAHKPSERKPIRVSPRLGIGEQRSLHNSRAKKPKSKRAFGRTFS